MVSISPNLFHIKGVVTVVGGTDAPESFCAVHIRLKKVEHLQGPASFLSKDEKEIKVLFPDPAAANLNEGAAVQCNVRRTPAGFIALANTIEGGQKKSG